MLPTAGARDAHGMLYPMSTVTAQALSNLVEAGKLIALATSILSGDVPAGHAAIFALYVEEINQKLSRAQIHAAHALRRTGAHKLDQASFQAVSDAGVDPTLEQLEAAEGHATTGRTHFKDAKGMMTDWLNIPRGTAGTRLVQADCLLGGVDQAGQPVEPWLPELAAQFEAPNVDPRLVASTALKLHSARNDFGDDETGQAEKARLEAESVAFLRSEPKSARKHINDLVAQVQAGKRPLKALLERIGIFKKGMRQGLIEYTLRVLPSQAAYIEAYFAQLDNPATVAGNRDGLKDAEAQFTGQQDSGWDDAESKPDWAKDDPVADEETEDDSPPADNNEQVSETSDDEEECCRPGDPEERNTESATNGAVTPWEDLKPERRRLVGFMAMLMSDRTSTSDPPGQRAGLVAPQVSIILNWDKMQEQAQDFAVTSSGMSLSAGEVRTALCNAGVYPVVLNGQSLPLDLGRTQRLYSKSQRRAIRAAYRGCSYPGCSMPVERCEIDHLDAWEKGGRTDIKSAGLNCLIHHTARHCGLFHAVKIPESRPMVLLSPELDPEQKLRINTYFMTPAEALEAEALADETTAKWRAGELDVEIVEP